MNLIRLDECKVKKKNVKHGKYLKFQYWTPQALRCYQIGCMCSKCEIPKIIEEKCLMKVAVIMLVEKFGRPFDRKSNVI